MDLLAFDEALSRFGCTSTVSAIGSRTLHPPEAPRRQCDLRSSAHPAGVLELVDRPGLGPGARKSVWVRLPPPAFRRMSNILLTKLLLGPGLVLATERD